MARRRLLPLWLVGLAAASLPAPTPAPGTEPSEAGSLAGQLLVAAPGMRDPRFVRTVIFMVRHDRSGAMGLIVNRPLGEVPLALVLEQLGIEPRGARGSIRVHYGGPVQFARGFVLHSPEWRAEGTTAVHGEAAVTTSPEVLRAIADGKGPRRSIFLLGYAGWAAGQLERELEGGSWLVAPADEALLFDGDHETKWPRARDRQVIHL